MVSKGCNDATKKAPPKAISAGPLTLHVTRYDACETSLVATPNDLFSGTLYITGTALQTQKVEIEKPTDISGVLNAIQSQTTDILSELVPEESGTKLAIKSKTPAPDQTQGLTVTVEPPKPTSPQKQPGCKCDQTPSENLSFLRTTPDYLVNLDNSVKAELTGKRIPVYVQAGDGRVYDLVQDKGWYLSGASKPLATLVIGNMSDPVCEDLPQKPNNATIEEAFEYAEAVFGKVKASKSCHLEYTLARRLFQQDIIVATELEVHAGPQSYQSFLIVHSELLADPEQFVPVNGQTLNPSYGPLKFDLSFTAVLSIYRSREQGCRLFTGVENEWASLKFFPPAPPYPFPLADNGITVGPAKIFDTTVLKKMLADTATQLAAISGFNAAPINSAIGNFQGVTRDVSFLSAQVTTVPLPGVTSNVVNGTTGTAGTTTTTPVASSPGTVTIQCPEGSLPTIGSGGLQQCTAITGNTNIAGSTSTITTVPAATSQQTTGNQTSQQNTVTTTAPVVTPTIPTAPTSTALNAPSNVGISSADILTEQVQLNSQITTLRLLLQGATSDQYLTAESRATGLRQQTTIGFAVSLDPPRQYKHAVAEVRIIIVPPVGRDGVSIMTLLPSEKTYNVAKVTSHQNAFGAGVAVSPVTVGVNTGKSKDRLYLAKDTDTIALQYKEPKIPVVSLPEWYQLHDTFVGLINLNLLDPCAPISAPTKGSAVFGWQFRPALGADYVKAGQRQVFAQLALPARLMEDYVPAVYVQTRWREYDEKRQVVGQDYKNSCTVDTDRSGITLLSPLIIRRMNVTDIGNGQVRLTAQGTFFASGITVRSGPNNVAPTSFDGQTIETFASIHDVLQMGDLSLVAQNGIKQPFAIVTNPDKSNQCGITDAKMTAIPHPDGTAHVHLHFGLGQQYNLDDNADGPPQPFVLIGSQVYGNQESPFVSRPSVVDPRACKPAANRSAGP
jgi:hypothetical protein